MRLTSTKWPRWLVPNWVSNPSAVLPHGRRHDAGVGDDEIERPAVGDQRVGAGAHALQRGQVELDELKSAAVRGAGAHRARSPPWPCSRSRAAPTTSAPCAASARAVSTPRPAETPVTSTRLPLRSTPSSTSSVVDSAPKVLDMIVSRFNRRKVMPPRRDGKGLPAARAKNKRRMSSLDIRRYPPLSKRTRKI